MLDQMTKRGCILDQMNKENINWNFYSANGNGNIFKTLNHDFAVYANCQN